MDDKVNNEGNETQLQTVKDKIDELYEVFDSKVPVYGFYGKKISDTITGVIAHDVTGQIDEEDGSRMIEIDTIKLRLLHNGELVKSFSKPVEPRIEYTIECQLSFDGEEKSYEFNLKELRVYKEKRQYNNVIYSVILTDGKHYLLLETYNEKKRYDKRDELLWFVILAWERNYFVDQAYINYVKSHERITSSGNSFMSLFGSGGSGNSSLNSTKQIENGYEELEKLIGLETIKRDIKELANFLKMQKKRKDKGMKTVPVTLHLVFTGNPGTGKTTIARILASIYKDIGALSKGHVVEVDRADLVAEYIGQTATKTAKKIKEAMGGILFIDEAYTLAKGDGKDFGQEAIDTLLKAMEDHREDFIVIVAGYPAQMHTFINSNPGLKSRFNKYINFPDYSAKELLLIFKEMCDNYEYHLTEEAEASVKTQIVHIEKTKKENFANARTIRNLFEKIISRQASRLVDADENADLTEITKEDVILEELPSNDTPVKGKGTFHVVE